MAATTSGLKMTPKETARITAAIPKKTQSLRTGAKTVLIPGIGVCSTITHPHKTYELLRRTRAYLGPPLGGAARLVKLPSSRSRSVIDFCRPHTDTIEPR